MLTPVEQALLQTDLMNLAQSTGKPAIGCGNCGRVWKAADVPGAQLPCGCPPEHKQELRRVIHRPSDGP